MKDRIGENFPIAEGKYVLQIKKAYNITEDK